MKTLNMISGGKMGDFLHQLFIPATIYKNEGIKTDLFIADIGDSFLFGVKKAYEELYNIVTSQEYINSFQIYNGEKISIDLSSWRSRYSDLGWTEKLHKEYISNTNNIDRNLQIINFDKKRYFMNDSLVINRSLDSRRHSDISFHEGIIKQFQKRYFVYYDIEQYNSYPFKEIVMPIFAENIEEFFTIINSCKLFIGNLSGPMAIAYCLRKNILCEFGCVDYNSYYREINYYYNISWHTYNHMYISYELEKIGLNFDDIEHKKHYAGLYRHEK